LFKVKQVFNLAKKNLNEGLWTERWFAKQNIMSNLQKQHFHFILVVVLSNSYQSCRNRLRKALQRIWLHV